MLHLSFATAKDLQEAAIIDRRRKAEEERKQRIFNARNRIIGVDVEALEQQLDEKAKIREEERETERRILAEEERQRALALLKEKELQLKDHRIKKEINEFRLYVQKPEYRRDFDLYDPRAKQKELPARISDNDPRLTVSSAQIFDGEDLTERDRRRMQTEQQRAWLQQQMAERRQTEENRKKAEAIEYEARVAREKRALQLEQQERRAKESLHAATVRFNLELAAEQRRRNEIKHREEQEDNMAEQINNITSEMLTESTDAVDSSYGPHRVVPYTYRRMSAANTKEILEEREHQVEKLQEKRVETATTERQWEQLTESYTNVMTQKEHEVKRKVNDKFGVVTQENKQLADEQKRTREFIDKVVYTNPPTQEYFDQFNTTSR